MSQVLDLWWMILLISECGLVQTEIHPLEDRAGVVFVKGQRIKGLVQGNGKVKFLGIPYADVDKDNPFGPAKPHSFSETNEVFEAFFPKVCPQEDDGVFIGTIDCLTLDIHVPKLKVDILKKLTVMVWIKSDWGSGKTVSYTGFNYLVRHDVIVVAINYRLGAYGFMCLDIPEVPGNQGLKDQVLALRWIKQNIGAFGGNPEDITAIGGASVNLHLFSSNEKLFERAIIQSGSALTPLWAKRSDHSESISKFISDSGHNTTDIKESLKHLLAADPYKVVKLFEGASYPSVEKWFKGVESFITQHPRNVVSAKARSTPVIIGYYDQPPDDFNWTEVFTLDFDIENGTDYDYAERIIRQFYFGEDNITETYLHKDFFLFHPIHRMAELLLRNGNTKVYRYVFSYSGGRKAPNRNSSKVLADNEFGYLFDHLKLSQKTTLRDKLMVDRMTTLWTNFAKLGDPTPKVTKLFPVKWEPITKDRLPYFNINSQLSIQYRAAHDRMTFWDMFYKYYKKYQK